MKNEILKKVNKTIISGDIITTIESIKCKLTQVVANLEILNSKDFNSLSTIELTLTEILNK
jgi:hypothetical protein